MKIELCEDNGCFRADGIPSLVILQITRDDGKVVRAPYEAGKSIAELYQDIAVMADKAPAVRPPQFIKEAAPVVREIFSDLLKSSEIEREDIVKCVKVIPREEGVEQDIIPVVGKEYRIINIIKQNGELVFYEVLDDAKDNKIRMPMYPEEVVLARKRVPPSVKIQEYSVIKRCGCGEDNALPLHFSGEKYYVQCTKCGMPIEEKRQYARKD